MTKPAKNLPDLESVIQSARTDASSREQPKPSSSIVTTFPMVASTPQPSASANGGQPSHIVDSRANSTLKRLTIIAIAIILLLVGAVLVFVRMRQQQMAASQNIPNQSVSVQGTPATPLPVISLTPDSEKLVVTKDLISQGSLYFASGNFFGQLKPSVLTANQEYVLPNASGTICLDSNNCGYATPAQLAAAMQTAVTTINNRNQTITVQGTPNQITVTTDGNTITLSLSANLALTGSTTQNGNLLCDASNNCNYASASTALVQGGNTFGTDVVAGAKDNQGLNLITNNTTRVSISNVGVINLGGSSADRLVVTAQIAGANPLVFQGATEDGNTTTLAVADPTANNTVTLPNASGTICLNTGNCAGSGGYGNVLQGGNTFNTTMVLGTNDAYGLNLKTNNINRITMSNTGDIALLGNTTLTNDVILGSSNVNRLTFNGEITGGTPFVFQGATEDGFSTTLVVSDPTANRTIILPNEDGTICLSSGAGCPGGGSGDVLQGGNNFAATMVLGTNDDFGLNLKTNNIDRLTITNAGAATFTGDLTIQGNATLGASASSRVLINGQILGGTPFVFQGATDDGFTTQFLVADPTATRTITLPNSDGTICLDSGNCTGQGGYGDVLQGGNNFAATMVLGTNDNFGFNLKTNNTNRLTITNTGVITALYDFNVSGNTALAGTLQVTGDATIGAGSSLKLVGGTSFPLSPTEGQVFYRSDSNQLYVYDGTRWQADRSSVTYIVAASNSVNKEKADFVGDGTNDQNAINAAIAALPATGGAVVLLDGTFNLTTPILLNKTSVTLQGQGESTVLKRMWDSSVAEGVVTVSTTSATISQLKIDGNKTTYTNVNNHGIYAGQATDHSYLRVQEVTIRNVAGTGIFVISGSQMRSNYMTFVGNRIFGSSGRGIYLQSYAKNTLIDGNIVESNGSSGIESGCCGSGVVITNNVSRLNGGGGIVPSDEGTIVTNNTVEGNTSTGITIGVNSIIASNVIKGNGGNGISIPSAQYSGSQILNNRILENVLAGINLTSNSPGYFLVSGNTIWNNTREGVIVGGNSEGTSISENDFRNNGGAVGINSINVSTYTYVHGKEQIRIVDNTITDSVGTGNAIYINPQARNTYLSGNTYSGAGASSILDNGIGTIWDNQVDANGNIGSRGQAGIALNGTTTNYSLQNTGSFVQGGLATPAAPTVATQGTTGATSWSYAVTAYDGLGETLASTATTVTTGNAALDSSNFNRITPARVNGAVSYRVYRTAAGGTPSSTGYIGAVAGGAATFYLDDTGLAASGVAPVANTTGTGSFINLLQNGNQVCDNSGNCSVYALASGGTGYIQNGTTPQTANIAVQSASAGSIGAVIQGAASQTANLQEWQNSNGTVLASMNASGDMTARRFISSTNYLNLFTAANSFIGGFQSNASTTNADVALYGFARSGTLSGQYYGGLTGVYGLGQLLANSGANGTEVLMVRGVYAQADRQAGGTGILRDLIGLDAIARTGSSGTTFRAYGARLGVTGDSQTSYGLYISETTGTHTAQYGIYQAGAADMNYLAGNIGINNTVPANRLSINTPTTADSLAQGLIATGALTNKGLVIQGAASQTANLQEWQSSNGNMLSRIGPTGVWQINGTSDTNASVGINALATGKGLVVRSSASSANLQEWQSSSGTAQSWVTPSGVLRLVNGVAGDGATLSGTQLVISNTNQSTPLIDLHSINTANRIVLRDTAGTIVTVFNSSGYLGINNISPANKLSINTPTTADSLAQGLIATGAAGNKGLVIQSASGQSANLQEWQDSTGAVLASLSATGDLSVVNATITGTLTVTSAATFNNTLTVNGHIITGNTSGSTTAAAGSDSGLGANVVIDGNDTSGTITITTGTGVTAGQLATVTFAGAYGAAPRVVLTPASGVSAGIQYFVGDVTSGTFTVDTNNAATDSTEYRYYYHVMQ